MKRIVYLCLLGGILWPLQIARAQEKPKSEEKAKSPAISMKVMIVFTEFDGEKKISSMPYSFVSYADEINYEGTSIRNGVRIPVEVDSKDQKTTYLDVGSNIDCRVLLDNEGRFRLNLIFERTALYPNRSPEGERLVSQPNGQPLIRAFRTNQNFILKDGQTVEGVLSTDPLDGHSLHVSITINTQK